MFKKTIIAFFVLSIGACNSQKSSPDKQQVVTEEIATDLIEAFLMERNYAVLESPDGIVEFDIVPVLIKGTENEYQNKLFYKDTLKAVAIEKLLFQLKNDKSYQWNAEEITGFDPSKHFEVKRGDHELTLLFDKSGKYMGFVNLEGLQVIALSEEFRIFVEELIEND